MARYILISDTGETITTPDSAGNSIVGDIDIRTLILWEDYTVGSARFSVNKYVTAGNQRSFRWGIDAGGGVEWRWSVDGIANILEQGTATPYVDGLKLWSRITTDVDDGASNYAVKYYTAPGGIVSPVAADFTQHSVTDTGAAATSIFDGTAEVRLQTGAAGDRIYQMKLYDGIDGTLKNHFNAEDFALSDGDTSTAVAATGETWTLNGSGLTVVDEAGYPHNRVAYIGEELRSG